MMSVNLGMSSQLFFHRNRNILFVILVIRITNLSKTVQLFILIKTVRSHSALIVFKNVKCTILVWLIEQSRHSIENALSGIIYAGSSLQTRITMIDAQYVRRRRK